MIELIETFVSRFEDRSIDQSKDLLTSSRSYAVRFADCDHLSSTLKILVLVPQAVKNVASVLRRSPGFIAINDQNYARPRFPHDLLTGGQIARSLYSTESVSGSQYKRSDL
jgi:hypothetical protein